MVFSSVSVSDFEFEDDELDNNTDGEFDNGASGNDSNDDARQNTSYGGNPPRVRDFSRVAFIDGRGLWGDLKATFVETSTLGGALSSARLFIDTLAWFTP